MESITCEVKWNELHASFERQHDPLLENHPDVAPEIAEIRATLIKIWQLVKEFLKVNGNCCAWRKLVHRAEADRTSLWRRLNGKALFTGLVQLCTTTHMEVIESVQANHREKEQSGAHKGFKEQRRLN
jgi:hypothetical protein